jgi:hypothetical protein
VATLEILHDEAKAWGRRAASALSARSDLGKVARLRGGGCGSSVHQEHIKEVSFPAVTPEEREIHQQAATGDPIERRRLGNVYDEAESIWEAMRAGEAILVRASWLLKRAGYEEGEVEVMDFGEPTGEKAPGWVLRRDAAPLPHRPQIEKDHPEAVMPVEECEAGQAKMREVVAGATGSLSGNVASPSPRRSARRSTRCRCSWRATAGANHSIYHVPFASFASRPRTLI